MTERVTLTNRDGVRVFAKPADVERLTSAGFSEQKAEEKPKAPATRKRAPRKTTTKSE